MNPIPPGSGPEGDPDKAGRAGSAPPQSPVPPRWPERPRLPDPRRPFASRAELLMAAAAVLIVGLGIYAAQRMETPPESDPIALPSAGPAPGLPTMAPLPDALASYDPLADASAPAALATTPALPLPPPPPSAVLAPETDAVFAAPVPARPDPAPSDAPSRKRGSVLIFDAGADDGGGQSGGADAPMPDVSLASPRRTPAAPARPVAGSAKGTLTQGTTIPAVLESAIDSSRPGGVRALVSTDVRSADGRRLLVPRSSRLVGQYRGDPGKGRAFVVWTRIERPDGSRVPLGSVNAQPARFGESYAASPLVSQVGGAGAAKAGETVRVRPGEPIRVVAARNLDMQETRR